MKSREATMPKAMKLIWDYLYSESKLPDFQLKTKHTNTIMYLLVL